MESIDDGKVINEASEMIVFEASPSQSPSLRAKPRFLQALRPKPRFEDAEGKNARGASPCAKPRVVVGGIKGPFPCLGECWGKSNSRGSLQSDAVPCKGTSPEGSRKRSILKKASELDSDKPLLPTDIPGQPLSVSGSPAVHPLDVLELENVKAVIAPPPVVAAPTSGVPIILLPTSGGKQPLKSIGPKTGPKPQAQPIKFVGISDRILKSMDTQAKLVTSSIFPAVLLNTNNPIISTIQNPATHQQAHSPSQQQQLAVPDKSRLVHQGSASFDEGGETIVKQATKVSLRCMDSGCRYNAVAPSSDTKGAVVCICGTTMITDSGTTLNDLSCNADGTGTLGAAKCGSDSSPSPTEETMLLRNRATTAIHTQVGTDSWGPVTRQSSSEATPVLLT